MIQETTQPKPTECTRPFVCVACGNTIGETDSENLYIGGGVVHKTLSLNCTGCGSPVLWIAKRPKPVNPKAQE